MKHICKSLMLFVISFLLVVSVAQTQEKTSSGYATVLKGKQGKHSFQIRFVTGDFRKQRHKIKMDASGWWPFIDGEQEVPGLRTTKDGTVSSYGSGAKNWYGTDGGLPNTEFYSFRVTVDGKQWPVPASLWNDCYEPSLRNLWTALSPNGQQLAMGMKGSDAAGSYYVIWYFRADGRHSREFRNSEEFRK